MNIEKIKTAVVVAKPLEAAAASTVFDEGSLRNYRAPNDLSYSVGQITSVQGNTGEAILSVIGMGNHNSAIGATKLLEAFPNLEQLVLVGIAGVIQTAEDRLNERGVTREEVALLGDVLVSTGFVFAHDHGKVTPKSFIFKGEQDRNLDQTAAYIVHPNRDDDFGRFHPHHFFRNLPSENERAIQILQQQPILDIYGNPHKLEGEDNKWTCPTKQDPLLRSVPGRKLASWIYDGNPQPRVFGHEAFVASGQQVIASQKKKKVILDTFRHTFSGVKRYGGLFMFPPLYEGEDPPDHFKLMIEMEAAGIARAIVYNSERVRATREVLFASTVVNGVSQEPTSEEVLIVRNMFNEPEPSKVHLTVIKAVSDYCDGKKKDDWQRFAALQAAGVTRMLLRNAEETFL